MRRVERLIDFAAERERRLLVLPAGEKIGAAHDRPADRPHGDRAQRGGGKAARTACDLAVEAPYFGRPIDRLARAAELMEALDPSIELGLRRVAHRGRRRIRRRRVGAPRAAGRRSCTCATRSAATSGGSSAQGASTSAACFDAMDATGYAGDIVLELETRNSPYATKEDEVTAAIDYLRSIRPADGAHPGDSA